MNRGWCFGLLALLPLWAGAAEPARPVLTVTGDAEVRVAPDRAELRFGTVSEAKEAAKAQEKATLATAGAVAALKELGIPKARISTEALQLNPVYSRADTGARRITGYRASHGLKVEILRLARVGAVIDAATGAGANQLRSLTFGLQDSASAQRAALRKAAANGRAKAQALAESLGVRLVELVRAAESNRGGPPVPMLEAARAATATAVQPGRLTVKGSVTLEFGIEAD